MTNSEILSTILAMPGAQMCRVNKTNFVAIPTEDGYAKVAIGTALARTPRPTRRSTLTPPLPSTRRGKLRLPFALRSAQISP